MLYAVMTGHAQGGIGEEKGAFGQFRFPSERTTLEKRAAAACDMCPFVTLAHQHYELSAVQANLKRRHYFMTAQFNLLLKEFPKTTPEKKKVRPSRERQKNPGAC